MMKNMNMMKKQEIKEILVFSRNVEFEERKNGGTKNLFIQLKRKIR